jgi:hypothetical protein
MCASWASVSILDPTVANNTLENSIKVLVCNLLPFSYKFWRRRTQQAKRLYHGLILAFRQLFFANVIVKNTTVPAFTTVKQNMFFTMASVDEDVKIPECCLEILQLLVLKLRS